MTSFSGSELVILEHKISTLCWREICCGYFLCSKVFLRIKNVATLYTFCSRPVQCVEQFSLGFQRNQRSFSLVILASSRNLLKSSRDQKQSIRMDFSSGHHPFASGQHHFASGENNCKKFFAIPQYPHPYIIFWQIKTPDFIFQLLSIISHPFGFILQQTPIQNYIAKIMQKDSKVTKLFCLFKEHPTDKLNKIESFARFLG